MTANTKQEQTNNTFASSFTRTFCCVLLTLTALAGLGVFLGVHFTSARTPKQFIQHPGNFIPQGWFGDSPFDSTTPANASRWVGFTSGRGGLQLDIINALDSDWYPYFNLAVSQWDNGTPDCLTLTTSISTPGCRSVEGKLLVCNDDFGDTQWNGINEVVLVNDLITESVAKMNEYYLKGM